MAIKMNEDQTDEAQGLIDDIRGAIELAYSNSDSLRYEDPIYPDEIRSQIEDAPNIDDDVDGLDLDDLRNLHSELEDRRDEIDAYAESAESIAQAIREASGDLDCALDYLSDLIQFVENLPEEKVEVGDKVTVDDPLVSGIVFTVLYVTEDGGYALVRNNEDHAPRLYSVESTEFSLTIMEKGEG